LGHRLLYSPRSTSIVHTEREREREREFLCMELWQSALGLPPHPSCTHAYVNGTMKSLMMIDDKREREPLP